MDAPTTRYVRRSDGVSIAYQVIGEGPADLLYVPGFISHLDLMWAEPGFVALLRRLTSFSRVIMFDKPGSGLSDPVTHIPSPEERMGDIRLVLDEVGSQQAVLLGFSEGAAGCVLFATAWPERTRALILYGAIAKFGLPDPDEAQTLGFSLEEFAVLSPQWAAGLERIRELPDHWGEGEIGKVFCPSAYNPLQRRVFGIFERSAASPAMARALIEAMYRVDLTDVLPAVRVPTLVLHRSGDVVPVVCGRYLASRIPGARYVELPGDDHAFWLGDLAPAADEIERFVTGAIHPADPDRVLMTVLFCDIVASTQTAARLGDARWRDLRERFDDICRGCVERFRGRVVNTTGDGFLAVFDGPARAVRCTTDLRDALSTLALEVRVGVHTGECETIGGDIAGLAVHIAARVMALAQPNEVLVSRTVRDLVVGSELTFADRGVHTLKGVPGDWPLYAATAGPDPAPKLPAPTETMTVADRTVVRVARHLPAALRLANRLTRRRVSPEPRPTQPPKRPPTMGNGLQP
jgi:class 3 adenylate cyclase